VRIIGIDPGFGILGWAVIEDDLKIIDFGAIETPRMMPIDERLFIIHTDLSSIIKRYRPDTAVIEKLFFSRNTTTAFDVARATGVILLTFREFALPYQEVTPMQVKQGVTGYGKAEKKQVQEMVQRLFRLKELPQPDDAADALAIALCYSKYPICK